MPVRTAPSTSSPGRSRQRTLTRMTGGWQRMSTSVSVPCRKPDCCTSTTVPDDDRVPARTEAPGTCLESAGVTQRKESGMSEEVRDPQTPPEPRVVVTVGQASAALTEAGQAAAGTSPGAYEVMRVLDEAEQATTVTLFM